MWAPNKSHSAKNAECVATALEKADEIVQEHIKKGMTRKQAKSFIEDALQKIGSTTFI